MTPTTARRRTSGQLPVEQIRRREVTRVLRRTDLSSAQQEIVERLSCSLVRKILRGPISEIAARIETTRADGRSAIGEGGLPAGPSLETGEG